MDEKIKTIIKKYGHDRARLIDMLRDIQIAERMIRDVAIVVLAQELHVSQVEVKGISTFYHFFTKEHSGLFTIYLDSSVTSEMMGMKDVAKAFEREAGCEFGLTSQDQVIGLRYTACIGMSDQAPAALINGFPFINLTADKARFIIKEIRAHKKLSEIASCIGEVKNNIKKEGEVFFQPDKYYIRGEALFMALTMSPEDVINEIQGSRLTGRGGAGFSTGMKWQWVSQVQNNVKYIICNADEGEPGTFKDRVLLTKLPGLIFEGMIIAAYATKATKGILYLRMEYTYLFDQLNEELINFRRKNFLGKKINETEFSFDIEIRLGAGSYVCGEETALIESLEGKRGEPRNKPPFPIQSGYFGKPTLVNNVETFCAAAQIIKFGSSWYKKMGTEKTSGTKLLSVSGDVDFSGIYEVQWGLTIGEFLKMVGAKDARAIVVGGPSGKIISATEIHRKLAAEDLPTAGAMVVLNSSRDLLGVVFNYMKFFTDESCGVCLPCRGGNVLLTDIVEKIRSGQGDRFDLEKLVSWSHIIKSTSRCGLGQTSSQPILSTLASFREEYEKRVDMKTTGIIAPFNLETAEASYNRIFNSTQSE